MQPAEAIGILRGTISPASVLHPQIAADLGAQALEAWAWVERTNKDLLFNDRKRVWMVLDGWIERGHGTTPLLAVLDAMEKEKGNG